MSVKKIHGMKFYLNGACENNLYTCLVNELRYRGAKFVILTS